MSDLQSKWSRSGDKGNFTASRRLGATNRRNALSTFMHRGN
jgi:hypothetical protein